MVRTTISLPEELARRLRELAAERQTTVAELVREASEEKLAARRTRPRSLGIGASGQSDVARRTAEEPAVPRPWR